MLKHFSQFIRDARQETARVTWPTRKETVTTTIVVLIMIVIVSVILMLADGLISAVVKFILGSGASQ